MSKIKYNISLDMRSSVSQASVAAKQGDDNRQFCITLRSGSQPYEIERGSFAVFSTILPKGEVIEDNCTIVDDEIIYDFTQNLTSQEGVLDIEIRLYGPDGSLITSPTFILVVSHRAAVGETVTSSNSFSALDTLYEETNALKNTVEDKLANGDFVGEKGEQGIQGPQGPQGIQGEKGEDVNYNLVANALKGSASGNPLVLFDVSPVVHTLKVKATGDNVSATNVVVCGKNLIQFPESHSAFGITMTRGSKGECIFNGISTGDALVVVPINLPRGNYAISFNNEIGIGSSNTDSPYFAVRLSGDNGSGWFASGNLSSANTTARINSTHQYFDKGNIANLMFNVPSGVALNDFIIKPQVEFGTISTDYEPHQGTSYTPNADGTVEGVTSIYPTTTLMTDTEDVILDVEYNRDANKVIAELYALVLQGGSASRIGYINLAASKWEGSASLYSQVVTINGVTENSKVDINPSIEQLAIFHAKDIAFVAENEDGVVTVYCIGQKPTADYEMQITITEVYTNA